MVLLSSLLPEPDARAPSPRAYELTFTLLNRAAEFNLANWPFRSVTLEIESRGTKGSRAAGSGSLSFSPDAFSFFVPSGYHKSSMAEIAFHPGMRGSLLVACS